MYSSGEFVVYGIHGVCRILGTEKQLVNRKRSEFYVLEPIVQKGSRFYLPVDNPTALAKLKSLLSVEELKELLNAEQIRIDCWIPEDSRRKNAYRELLNNADRLGLLQMLASLYRFKDEQEIAGRKFHQCDDNFQRDAERVLLSEISLLMELSMDQAREFLRTQLRSM